MRGMMGGGHLVRTGVAPPFAVDGVAVGRMGAGRPSLARRWVSIMPENCADTACVCVFALAACTRLQLYVPPRRHHHRHSLSAEGQT